MQGQGFRDEFQNFKDKGYEIIGVSADPPLKQKKFVERFSFQFTMLCDESHKMLEDYGVWGKKKFTVPVSMCSSTNRWRRTARCFPCRMSW